MEKKNKYITFSLDENNYNRIKEKAEKERRTMANYIYLVIVDHLEGKR